MRFALKIVALAAVAAFAGCISPTSGVIVEKGWISIEDPAFAANLEISRDVLDKTPEGFLRAQVSIKNTNRTDYRCQYRFEWREKNGMIQKHAPANWRPLLIHGRTTEDIEAVSPLQGSEDFRFIIRRAD